MTDEMCILMRRWQDDPTVKFIILHGTGRAFCAGGDLRAVVSGTTFYRGCFQSTRIIIVVLSNTNS